MKDINNKFLSELRKNLQISILNESTSSYVIGLLNKLSIKSEDLLLYLIKVVKMINIPFRMLVIY